MKLNNYYQKKVEEFEREFVVSHPGDSGIGGNTPQEPVCEIQYESPKEVIEWLTQTLREAQEREEKVKEEERKRIEVSLKALKFAPTRDETVAIVRNIHP